MAGSVLVRVVVLNFTHVYYGDILHEGIGVHADLALFVVLVFVV